MPLLFKLFCDLLEALEEVSERDPPFLPSTRITKYRDLLRSWLASYKISIHSVAVCPVTLLSSLFPAKRTDRVYGIQDKSLSRQLRGCLRLGQGRWQQLDQYQRPGFGDLGACVERVLQQAEFPTQPPSKEATLQQIDEALTTLAAKCRFSGRKVRSFSSREDNTSQILSSIYIKLQSREAKWFTRLILKDLYTIDLDVYGHVIFSCVDPYLPLALRLYDDFDTAVSSVKSLEASWPLDPIPNDGQPRNIRNVKQLTPRVGVKVGSPGWVKAKGGVKHALSLIERRTMSVERKYDGEYCQIHVDLTKGDHDCLQIFSKSGKDSTSDRSGVLSSIKQGLQIGDSECLISNKCILEGELIVWSDKDNKVEEFHKLRKHVPRSGVYIGTKEDSQPLAYEHLMLVLHDILLLDDDPILHRPYRERRRSLKSIVKPIKGRMAIVERQEVSFSDAKAETWFKEALAEAFAHRWEGLVLKPASESYFGLQNEHSGRWIKLKKDCIRGYGDSADFAVVGAGYDAKRARDLKTPNAAWTHFFIGCLQNKQAVQNTNAQPRFLVVDCVTNCIQKADLEALNQQGKFVSLDVQDERVAKEFQLEFVYMDPQLPKMRSIFIEPFVFDVAGSGFEKASNRSIFTLRFPRVLKICWDRDWKDCIDAPELQFMAEEARSVPFGDIATEISTWVEKLHSVDTRATRDSLASVTADDDESRQQSFNSSKRLNTKSTLRRSRLVTSTPPLIRMDSDEMQDNEWRLDDGSVIEQGNFGQPVRGEHAQAEPPAWSSFFKSPEGRSTADHWTKKQQARDARGKNHLEVSGASTSSVMSRSLRRPEPLKEIENASRPSHKTRPTLQESVRKSDTAFELVRQRAVGTEQDTGQVQRKRRRTVQFSSQDRETTADESSVASTSQILTIHARASPPTCQKGKVTSTVSALPTPPSSAESATVTMPDLDDGVILIGQSLSERSSKLRKFIGQRFPKASVHCMGSDDRFKLQGGTEGSKNNVEHIILTDTRKAEQASGDLINMVPGLRDTDGHSFEASVWDWRLLELATKSSPSTKTKIKEPRDAFVTKFSWRGESTGANPKIQLTWRDGPVDSLSNEVLRCLGKNVAKGSL